MRSWWLVGQFARRDVARDARRARFEKGGLRLRGGEGGWGAVSRDSFRLERGVEEGNDCNADYADLRRSRRCFLPPLRGDGERGWARRNAKARRRGTAITQTADDTLSRLATQITQI